MTRHKTERLTPLEIMHVLWEFGGDQASRCRKIDPAQPALERVGG